MAASTDAIDVWKFWAHDAPRGKPGSGCGASVLGAGDRLCEELRATRAALAALMRSSVVVCPNCTDGVMRVTCPICDADSNDDERVPWP